MALLIPSRAAALRQDGGLYRELDVVNQLVDGLPAGYEVFHGLELHTVRNGQDHYGEVDVMVMGPSGALLLLEVKAGAVIQRDGGIFKRYGSDERNVAQQCQLQRASLLGRLRGTGLDASVSSCLVLPDYLLGNAEIVSVPRERIVDAAGFAQLPALVRGWLAVQKGCSQTDVLRRFLYNHFQVVVDLGTARDQLLRTMRTLSDGLATWVPRIASPSAVVRVQATAGSGKTQLALRLLQDALDEGARAGYICYNRTLADYIRACAPPRAEVANFHELVIDHQRRRDGDPDFSDPQLMAQASARYVDESMHSAPRFDLLIIDEGQDFEPAWIEALCQLLHADGKLYLLEDDEQRLYNTPDFEIGDAVVVVSRDNFRSPRLVCDAINALELCRSPINSKSLYKGEVPGFHLYASPQQLLEQIERAVTALLARGFRLEDIAVLSYRGRAGSALTNVRQIGPWLTRHFTGAYTRDGEPVWTEGELLVESIYRYKGQSAPAVILAEVAFDTLTAHEKAKLFVGLTRAHMVVEMVLTNAAERTMLRLFDAPQER